MFKGKDKVFHFESTDKISENIFEGCKITQIYSGKDHWCRCGCGGKYYDDPTSPAFKRLVTRAKNILKLNPDGIEMFEGSDENWINVPTTITRRNHPGTCICIYFKGKVNIK